MLEHDYKDSDRGKLVTQFSNTSWKEASGRRNWKAGAMYRGNIPAHVTTLPYASDVLAKE